MSEELPPLSPELKALFEAEREAGPMPAAARAQLWQGLAKGLPKPPSKRSWLRHAAARHALTAAVSLGIGTAAGMALQARRDRDRIVFLPPPVLATLPTPSPQLPAPSAESPSPSVAGGGRGGGAPSPPTASTPIPSPPPHPPRAPKREKPSANDDLVNPFAAAPQPAPPAPEGTLQREQALIDTARTALSRGDAKGALGLLARYDRDYPQGELTEESQALRIQALLATDVPRAHEAAAAFQARYPHSLLLPAIQQSLERSR